MKTLKGVKNKMVFYKIRIGKYNASYKFPPKKSSSDYPYCDEQAQILERVNETKQQEIKIADLNPKVMSLDMKKQKGTITKEEEEELKLLQRELNARQEIYNLKPYYVNEATGEIRLKALKKVGDEALDKFKGRTSEISDNEYRETTREEFFDKEFQTEDKGFMICPELYSDLKRKGDKAIKYNAHYGNGWNEQRTYVYPSKIDGILIMVKVSQDQLYESMSRELDELKQVQEMKKLLEQATLQANEINKGKIAGSLDD
jgi:hypothetical protein